VVLLLVDLSAAVVVQQVHQEQAQAVLAAQAISMLAVLGHQEQELLLAVVEARDIQPTGSNASANNGGNGGAGGGGGGGASTLGTAGSGGNGVVLSLL
jgi:uncharacterized membrane protein YgcG